MRPSIKKISFWALLAALLNADIEALNLKADVIPFRIRRLTLPEAATEALRALPVCREIDPVKLVDPETALFACLAAAPENDAAPASERLVRFGMSPTKLRAEVRFLLMNLD